MPAGLLAATSGPENRCYALDFASRKSRTVVMSIMGGETCVCLDAFDASFATSLDLHSILGNNLVAVFYTESKQLFDALVKENCTTERHLNAEIPSVRQSYRDLKIVCIGLVRGADNAADGFTEVGSNRALNELIRTRINCTEVVEWIGRTKGE